MLVLFLCLSWLWWWKGLPTYMRVVGSALKKWADILAICGFLFLLLLSLQPFTGREKESTTIQNNASMEARSHSLFAALIEELKNSTGLNLFFEFLVYTTTAFLLWIYYAIKKTDITKEGQEQETSSTVIDSDDSLFIYQALLLCSVLQSSTFFFSLFFSPTQAKWISLDLFSSSCIVRPFISFLCRASFICSII